MSRAKVINDLKRTYKNSKEKDEFLGRDFIAPCLKHCVRYRRGTGTVSSSMLYTYVLSLHEILTSKIKIEILASPKIDNLLFEQLQKMTDDIEKNKFIGDEFVTKFLTEATGINKKNMGRSFKEELLCYLIANNILEIRFALPIRNIYKNKAPSMIFDDKDEEIYDNYELRNMYHIKQGYFVFDNEGKDNIVAFDGSVNETDTAL